MSTFFDKASPRQDDLPDPGDRLDPDVPAGELPAGMAM